MNVRAEVAERAASGHLLVHPPPERRVVVGHDPLLQVNRTVVIDLPQCAGLDQHLRLPDGGDKAVVEGDGVLDACFGHGLEHRRSFLRRARERLLAQDVLARFGGLDAGLSVRVVGATVVEQLDAVVLEHLPPVGVVALVAIAQGCFLRRRLVAPGDGDQFGDRGRRVHQIWNFLERVGVGFAHESVAQHPHADFGRGLFGLGPGHGGETSCFRHSVLLVVGCGSRRRGGGAQGPVSSMIRDKQSSAGRRASRRRAGRIGIAMRPPSRRGRGTA